MLTVDRSKFACAVLIAVGLALGFLLTFVQKVDTAGVTGYCLHSEPHANEAGSCFAMRNGVSIVSAVQCAGWGSSLNGTGPTGTPDLVRPIPPTRRKESCVQPINAVV